MFNVQANTARFIYTISRPDQSKVTNLYDYAQLNNGFILSKEARSDEKVRYTENNMFAIIRTALFMYVFEWQPQESVVDLVNTGELSDASLVLHTSTPNLLDIKVARQLLDHLFGKGFSRITRRVVGKCMSEYLNVWRCYPFHRSSRLRLPSVADFLKLIRFVNASTCDYSEITLFLLENTTDHRIPNQGPQKDLSGIGMSPPDIKSYLNILQQHQKILEIRKFHNNNSTQTEEEKEPAASTQQYYHTTERNHELEYLLKLSRKRPKQTPQQQLKRPPRKKQKRLTTFVEAPNTTTPTITL